MVNGMKSENFLGLNQLDKLGKAIFTKFVLPRCQTNFDNMIIMGKQNLTFVTMEECLVVIKLLID